MLIVRMYLNKKKNTNTQRKCLIVVLPNKENAQSCIPHYNRSEISGKSNQCNLWQNLGQGSKFVTKT